MPRHTRFAPFDWFFGLSPGWSLSARLQVRVHLSLCSLSWLLRALRDLCILYFWRAFLLCVTASIKTIDSLLLRVCIRVSIAKVFYLLFSFPCYRDAVCVSLELVYTDSHESEESIRLLWSSRCTEFASRWSALRVR